MNDTEKRLFVESKPAAQEPSAPAVEPDSESGHENTKSSPRDGFKSVRFNEHEVIFQEGDPGDSCYLIVRGRVEIRKGVMSSAPQTLALLSRGDVFGEMALFDNSPRMAEAVAQTKVEVIAIDREEFSRRLETVDPVMRSIVVYLVGRVRGMADEFMSRKDPSWGE